MVWVQTPWSAQSQMRRINCSGLLLRPGYRIQSITWAGGTWPHPTSLRETRASSKPISEAEATLGNGWSCRDYYSSFLCLSDLGMRRNIGVIGLLRRIPAVRTSVVRKRRLSTGVAGPSKGRDPPELQSMAYVFSIPITPRQN